MTKLAKRINNHEYPAIILKSVLGIRLLHTFENITRLRNWSIHREVNNILSDKKIKSVLDIGCGSAVFLLNKIKKYRLKNFNLSDMNEDRLIIVKSYYNKFRLNNLKYSIIDLDKFNLKTKYDFILCTSVLMYIKDDSTALQKIWDTLTDDGVLLLYVPINNTYSLSIYKYLLKQKLHTVDYNQANNQRRIYTSSEICEKLTSVGFKINKSIFTYGKVGRLGYEIFASCELGVKSKNKFYAVLSVICLIFSFPIVLLLWCVDYYLPKSDGNGLLLLAQKGVE